MFRRKKTKTAHIFPTRVGIYGKIRAEGDFIRIHAGHALVHALDGWLARSQQHGGRAHENPLAEPIHFLYCDGISGDAAVGTMHPSQDAVGRQFPIVGLAVLPAAALSGRWGAVAVTYMPCLSAIDTLLEQSENLDVMALERELAGIAPPGAAELEHSCLDMWKQFERPRSAARLSEMFSAETLGAHYAINTLHTACRQANVPPGVATVVLECPANTASDRAFWLACVESALGWTHATVAMLWRPGNPRCLLSLGAPPDALLTWFNDETAKADILWPLKSKVAIALNRAKAALPPAAVDALENDLGRLSALIRGRSNTG